MKLNINSVILIGLGILVLVNGRYSIYPGVPVDLGIYKYLVSFGFVFLGFVFLGFYLMTVKKKDQE